jgi:hypothetical protein
MASSRVNFTFNFYVVSKVSPLHNPATLAPGKKLGYPLNRRMHEFQNRSEIFVEKRKTSFRPIKLDILKITR